MKVKAAKCRLQLERRESYFVLEVRLRAERRVPLQGDRQENQDKWKRSKPFSLETSHERDRRQPAVRSAKRRKQLVHMENTYGMIEHIKIFINEDNVKAVFAGRCVEASLQRQGC